MHALGLILLLILAAHLIRIGHWEIVEEARRRRREAQYYFRIANELGPVADRLEAEEQRHRH